MKRNIAVDVLWVIFSLGIAYLGLKYDARPTDIGFEILVGPAIFIAATGAAIGFIKKTVRDFAQILRENAELAREAYLLQRLKENIRLEREHAHG